MKLKEGQRISLDLGDYPREDWIDCVVVSLDYVGCVGTDFDDEGARNFDLLSLDYGEHDKAYCREHGVIRLYVAAVLMLDQACVRTLGSFDGEDWTALWYPPESPVEIYDGWKNDHIDALAKFKATGIVVEGGI